MISLVTQYLFSGAQKRLFNRRTRAFEPDFEKAERDYAGPAQARLKKRKDRIVSGGSLSSGVLDKIRGIGITTIIVAACFVFGVFSDMLSDMGTTASRRTLALAAVLVTLIIMIIHTVRRFGVEAEGPRWPRLLAVLACGAGLAGLVLGQHEDLVYYACAGAMLAASAVELVIINRAHNEYASRPVPFFEREGEAS